MTLLLALRGAAAVLVLTTIVGGLPRLVSVGAALAVGIWTALLAAAVGIDGTAVDGAGGGVASTATLDALAQVAWWLVAAHEVVVGATLGLLAAMPLLAAAMAGRLVDVGAGGAGGGGGGAGGRGGPYATLFGVLAAAVFVGVDGHVAVVGAIVDSFRAAPAIADVRPQVLAALGGLVPAAVALAVPWLVTAAVVEIAVGVGMRVGGRAALHVPGAAGVPAALVMVTAALVSTLAITIAALVRGTL